MFALTVKRWLKICRGSYFDLDPKQRPIHLIAQFPSSTVCYQRIPEDVLLTNMPPRRRADPAERTVPAGRWTADQPIISISITLLQAFKRENVARSLPQIFGQIWKRYTFKFLAVFILSPWLPSFFFTEYPSRHSTVSFYISFTRLFPAAVLKFLAIPSNTLIFCGKRIRINFISTNPDPAFLKSFWIPNRILVLKCRILKKVWNSFQFFVSFSTIINF